MKKKTFQAMFLTLVLTGSLSVLPAAEEMPAETETESLIETETEALFETESAVLTEAGTEALLAEDGTESLLSEDGTEALSETETEPLAEAQPLPPVPMDLMKGAETITADNREAYFTDADNAPTDSMFYIEADARIANTPLGNSISRASAEYTDLRSVAGYLNGTLVTVSSGDLIRYQMFISGSSFEGDPNPSILYFRASVANAWTEWQMLSERTTTTSTNIAIRKKMIAPYLNENGEPTADDTGISNPQCMLDDPKIFNDFNNAPLNSIYQIDRDCDASVMANNPLPSRSSILITTGFAYTSRHGVIQVCIGFGTDRTTDIYYRYGYISDDYDFTSWEKILTTRDPEYIRMAECYNYVMTGLLELSSADFESGTWMYSEKAADSRRIRSMVSYKVSAGTVVRYTSPSMQIFLGVMPARTDTDTYTKNTGWEDPSGEEREFIVEEDGYLNIILQTTGQGEVVPNDYDCQITIE